ncbi:hypothetical protein Tsubulata_039409 [Turnera subulata]|uniref:Uncharacterized protein n=1 Tax=Turnera subulata TaxID=218843 RepID=A0A9Q0G527_9ROSI|nr:hypothetical protein Tsubulata_039409 [Turnera subulata]
MCSETSPRISFSNDLTQEEDTQVDQVTRRDTTLLDSNSEFEFSICSSLDHESSSADELFADGMILPFQIQDTNPATTRQIHGYEPPRKATLLPPLPSPADNDHQKKESIKEIIVANQELEAKPPSSKSLWGFKRSSSLNCDIKKSLCSLPLLSRSKSTGSAPNPKRATSSKDVHSHQKHSSQKQVQSNSMAKSASSAYTYVYSLPQKPPLKKNYGGSQGNGVRISPVLNVPPPYISKGTSNLFGFGYLLGNVKVKKKGK